MPSNPAHLLARSYRLLTMLSLAAVGAVVLVPYAGLTDRGSPTCSARRRRPLRPTWNGRRPDASADGVADEEAQAANDVSGAYVRPPGPAHGHHDDHRSNTAVIAPGLLPADPDPVADHRARSAGTAVGVIEAHDRRRVHRHRRRL